MEAKKIKWIYFAREYELLRIHFDVGTNVIGFVY